MKRAYLFAILAILAIAFGCQMKSKPLPAEIPFLYDLETAKIEAAKSKLPIIIDFYADTGWCQHCADLDTLTFKDSLIISMSNDFIFVKINVEVESALADRFGVTGYPTIVVTNPDGSEIDRIEGYMDATEFYNQVHLFLQGKETLDDYLARLEDEPGNPEYLLTIAGKYFGRTQYSNSIEFYHRVIALDPDNRRSYASRSWEGICMVQAATKDYKTAIATCQDIITRYPTSREADNASAMLGYYTALTGDEKGALAVYRDYLQKYPEGRNQWVQKRVADLEEKQ
jgi:thiol-disulfide isomerase/thioredoxin